MALSLSQESINITNDLGMKPLHERAVALLEQAKSMPAQVSVYPAGLTQREAEVLRLIASGKTDREIADELIISIRTVGNHVRNILNKTDSVNRTDATAFAVRHDLG
jgi:DNA-binding CsgD family transcriptional regulator